VPGIGNTNDLSFLSFLHSFVPNLGFLTKASQNQFVIAMNMSFCVCVCVSVCLRRYLRNHTHDLYQFCGCCLWPWIGPHPASLGYVMHFRFCGWHHVFFYNGTYSGM